MWRIEITIASGRKKKCNFSIRKSKMILKLIIINITIAISSDMKVIIKYHCYSLIIVETLQELKQKTILVFKRKNKISQMHISKIKKVSDAS